MKALITGASNGMGKDFAIELSKRGYDLVLVSRNKEKLKELQKSLSTKVSIEVMDLSIKDNVYKLYNKYKNEIDLLINNAGYGKCDEFVNVDLDTELNMIDLNVITYHILTKLFLKDFVKKDSGKILNVASVAAFQPGPLMSTYYATKSYVYSLSMSIYEELRKNKSNVHISILCPGPVNTGFNERANVKFALKGLESNDVVKYTLKKLDKNKLIIIPGTIVKIGVFMNRLLSRKFVLKFIYNTQKKKISR